MRTSASSRPMRRIYRPTSDEGCAAKTQGTQQSTHCDDVRWAASGHRASRLRHSIARRPVLGHCCRHPQYGSFCVAWYCRVYSAAATLHHWASASQFLLSPMRMRAFSCNALCLLTLASPEKNYNAATACSRFWLLLPVVRDTAAPARSASACQR